MPKRSLKLLDWPASGKRRRPVSSSKLMIYLGKKWTTKDKKIMSCVGWLPSSLLQNLISDAVSVLVHDTKQD